MNRYYLSPRSGSGIPGSNDPYTSPLRNYIRQRYDIKFKRQIISHVFPWCLHKYDLTTTQHDDVMANVANVFAVPAGALDREVSSLTTPQRNAFRNAVANTGLSMSWVTGTTTVREILQYIAHTVEIAQWACPESRAGRDQVEARLTAGNLNIREHTWGDLPQAAKNKILQHLADLGISRTPPDTMELWRIVRAVQRQDDESTPRLYSGNRWFYHDAESD